MKKSKLIAILKANENKIENKEIQFNSEIINFNSLYEVIEKLDEKTYNFTIDLCTNDHAFNFGLNGLEYTFEKNRFQQVKIFAGIPTKSIFIQPSEEAIKNFGTNN